MSAAATSDHGMTTGEPHEAVWRSWNEVHQQARRTAAGLIERGLRPGEAVAVLASDPAAIAPAAQAVWLAGGSVTMLHQPTARSDLAVWAADTVRILEMVGARRVLLGPPFDGIGGVLDEHGVVHHAIDQLATDPAADVVDMPENATAFLQLTSGSTAMPKAVRITHGNLYANIMAMVEASGIDPAHDTMLSWLPTFHDMGMVGFLTTPMTTGVELVKVTPQEFMSRPLLWAELIDRYRATITAAPNFAYALLGRRLAGAEESYDLSSMRFAINGAEPIDPTAVRSLTDAGARFGLDPRCIICAYGMAESTLAVSFAPRDVGMEIDVIDAVQLEVSRRAALVADTESDKTRAFPLLGPPLPGIETVIVGDSGEVLGDREVGHIRLRGESVTPGYLTVDGPLSTQDDEGWLDTGDIGYLVDGSVVVCGRRKDVIIMGGRNVYPTDIERAASTVDGVRAGNVVAVRIDVGQRREGFAVVAESRLAGEADAERDIRKAVTSAVVDAIGLRPFAVVVLPPSSLPKTPSGKLRRAAAGEQVKPLLASG